MEIKKTVTIEHCKAARIKCTARIDMPEYGIVAGERFHLVRVSGTTYEVKRIQVTSRSTNKASGDIRFSFVNNDGDAYWAYVCRDGKHACSCKATTRCYHLNILIDTENARLARLRVEKVAKVATTAVVVTAASTNTSLYAHEFSLLKPAHPTKQAVLA